MKQNVCTTSVEKHFRDFGEVSISVVDTCVKASGEPIATVKTQDELNLQTVGTFPCETKPHFEHSLHVREFKNSPMKLRPLWR